LRSSPYYCPACDIRMRRKSNALRHLETIHDNRGVLYDRSNNLVDTTAKAAVPFWLNRKPRHDGGGLRGLNEKRLDNDAMPSSQAKTMESNNVDGMSEDEVYYGCVGELGLPLDELDTLLSGHFPGMKGKIRGMVLLEALASPDPAKYLRESLSLCKGILCSNKIIDCISSCYDIPKPVANSLVRNSIWRNAKSKGDSNGIHLAPG
jgi:hypothetical protein